MYSESTQIKQVNDDVFEYSIKQDLKEGRNNNDK